MGGDIGPFQLAIGLTFLCLVPIFFWRENYGSSDATEGGGSGGMSMMASLRASVKLIWQQPVVLFLGLSQACFEGAVFTFGKLSNNTSSHCIMLPSFIKLKNIIAITS